MKIRYKNWKGEIRIREIEISHVWFGKTQWHPKDQYLVAARDLEDQGRLKHFALIDCDFLSPQEVPEPPLMDKATFIDKDTFIDKATNLAKLIHGSLGTQEYEKCICCGKEADGTYEGKPVRLECYISGKLADFLLREETSNLNQ